MEFVRGKIPSALKVVVYGPEGIGKSTFAARFPSPVFIDTEGSTKLMDVVRTPRPSSWTMLLEQVRQIKDNPGEFKTLVIDTADWAEQLCMTEICAKAQKASIEDFGYGKGYVFLMEEFGRLLNLLEDVVERGMHVVITAHAKMRKFEQPDELGAYDRWEMKLQKQTAPLVKEWADMVLFANYKTYVINVDGQGTEKGKNKAQGGKRVMYTSHHPCWDAKNRHGLEPELPFDYAAIAHCLPIVSAPQTEINAPATPPTEEAPAEQYMVAQEAATQEMLPIEPEEDFPGEWHQAPPQTPTVDDGIPKALRDLMVENGVTEAEIQEAVAQKGYYPRVTPISNYDPGFISGVLVGAWPQVYGMIQNNRSTPL